MRVLVVNAGSSSLKLSVLDEDTVTERTTIERWEGAEHLEPLREFLDSSVRGGCRGPPRRPRGPAVPRVGACRPGRR